MNTIRKNIVIALTAFGLAGAAIGVQAQTQAPAEGRHGHALSVEQRQAKMAESKAKRQAARAERQAKLRDALKLTPAQQPSWDAFVASMTPAQKMDRAARPDRAQLASLSAPQRLQMRIERQKQRTARMEARLSALNSFYAVLTPEQRKVFDEQAKQHRGGRQHRGHGGHGMMHG
ncbi:Spy/CpxP family protein refolding chaperone [Massilia sp. ST3]|uniref:Spy/CpxP family protein refolding chaperone n=1 Tax=Massilia sp. ST3 TaxID=2824903 RepID=UPI001B8183B9|nr:Spy/CpxP family protein refolding chaperone [Massilia sp. ST3]MBQ5946854.1 Spy/CpxP family protein refolding chaperone [Massilia sp. ST3]